jgi:DNA-binding NarL/FixJ family response regulator
MIADDNVVLRDLFHRLLVSMPGLEVAGEAPDGDCAVELAETLRPDVLLADTCMPGPNGKYLARILQDRAPGTAALVMTVPEDSSDVAEAIEFGARGCLPKRCAPTDLLDAVRTVADGGIYIHADLLPDHSWVQELLPVGTESCIG